MLKLKLQLKQRMQKVQAYSKSSPIWRFWWASANSSVLAVRLLFVYYLRCFIALSTDCQDHSLSLFGFKQVPIFALCATSPGNCVLQTAGCPASIGDATSRLSYGKEGCGGRGPLGWWWERPEEDLEEVGRTVKTLRLMGLSLEKCQCKDALTNIKHFVKALHFQFGYAFIYIFPPHLHQIPTCKCQSRPFVVCGLCEFCVFVCGLVYCKVFRFVAWLASISRVSWRSKV